MKSRKSPNYKMLYGIREGNKSYKLFKKDDDEYFVVKKQHVLGLFKRIETINFKSLAEAQDYIIQNTNSLHNVYIE